MIKKNKILLGLILLTIITNSIINFSLTPDNVSSLKQKSSNNQLNEDLVKEEPFDLEPLKPADISEEQQNHNFSFNAIIKENWNQNFVFIEQNSTKLNDVETEWMILQDTEASFINSLDFYIVNLRNLTSMEPVYPSNFTTMYLSYLNESMVRENLSVVSDHGNGVGWGQVHNSSLIINNSANAQFVVWNDWIEVTNISYSALIFMNAYREYNLTTKFVPTKENTQSNFINWELNYAGHPNDMKVDQNYDASIKIDDLDNLTVNRVLGFDGSHWLQLKCSTNKTDIAISYLLNNS